MRTVIVVVVGVLAIVGCLSAGPETIEWDAPTVHEDGSPVIVEDLRYRVWRLSGVESDVLMEGLVGTTAIITEGGKYDVVVTAYYEGAEESEQSEPLTIRVTSKPTAPRNVRKK